MNSVVSKRKMHLAAVVGVSLSWAGKCNKASPCAITMLGFRFLLLNKASSFRIGIWSRTNSLVGMIHKLFTCFHVVHFILMWYLHLNFKKCETEV